ncbi:phenylalanine--tRNA ligase subunit alpha, partial [bacterium]|nr:phenylalanine--tRNA ligase subunit alpha [bacterium]
MCRPVRRNFTHKSSFHQADGLQVGRGISMANMRWILDEFARRFFGPETRTRLRPDYFPFVEPGAELAVTCSMCEGKGCRVCKETGWIEVMGCGMVHPQVLRNVNIDPGEYSGWAFGFGVERMAQVLYQVPDARMFFENDMRFLRQFS